MARRPAPRIKTAPKRRRKRTVHVKGYCRRKGEAAYRKAAKQAREIVAHPEKAAAAG